MTTDEIIAMAREAGFRTGQINLSNGPPVPFIAPASGTNCMVELERFAALVAAAEREACAAKIEAITYRRRWASASINGTPLAPCELATAIRAIGTP